MREFELYWARIEGVWGYIAGLYMPQVCEDKVSPCRALPRILHLPNVPLGQRPFPCRAVQRNEMLLADYIYTSLIQSFNLVAIGCLQGREDSNITGLELVGGMRGEATQYDVMLKAKL